MVKELDVQGFEAALGTNGKPIVVDFATGWCPYCKSLAPIIEEIANEYEDQIEVYYLDIDDYPDLADQYDVMTVPTVFVFLNGEIMASAVNPRTKASVLDLIFRK